LGVIVDLLAHFSFKPVLARGNWDGQQRIKTDNAFGAAICLLGED